MKTRISRIGKRILSVILAMLMIVSTMLVGMVSVNAATYYIAGNSSTVFGAEWSANGLAMDAPTSGTLYTKTLTNVPSGNYEFKITDGTWKNSWGKDGGSDNYSFTVSSTTDVTITFDSSTKAIEVKQGSTGSTTATYYIAGNSSTVFGAEWSANGLAMDAPTSGTLYTKTLTNVPSGNYEFKITDGTWKNSWGKDGGSDNYSFTVSSTTDVTITFDSSTKAIEVKQGSTEPTTAPTTAPTTPDTLATPVIKCDSSVVAGGTVEVTLDNLDAYADKTDVAFAYSVTASDGSTPTITNSSSGTIENVNDSISFTAGAEGVKYTINVTVFADGFDSVSASTVVTVKSIQYADEGRIYAYAKTLADGETPVSDAWVAAENNAAQQAVYHDTELTQGAVAYPTLGSATSTNLRIFLPTTASDKEAVLYNTSSGDLDVASVTIKSGEYGIVSYEPGKSQSITLNGVTKTLTIYKSSAEGALYLNNTGEYLSINEDGIPSMLTQLYSDKEEGEIKKGNSGAIADDDGTVKAYTVGKIKGRGNSTWINTDKKSFNVTFKDPVNSLGFSGGLKFSLLANFKDPSLSRNKILYALADEMGVKYSPNSAVVDLYMNGLYMGSYLMCQKVDIGENELINDAGVVDNLFENLYKTPADQTSDIKSNGFSFLMELDSNRNATVDYGLTVGDQEITVKEPEYFSTDEGYDPNVNTAIQSFIQTKYNALYSALSNNTISKADLDKIIDVDSLARYYLVNELAKNFDIGVTSTYFVYNKAEDKFYISPVWDMDVTTGNCDSKGADYLSYEGNWTDGNNDDYNRVMKLVYNNVHVQAAARSIWTADYYTTLIDNIDTLGKNAIVAASGSFENNFIKWTYPYGFMGNWKDDVQAKTSLKKATFNVNTGEYTKSTSATSYDAENRVGDDENPEGGQIQYVIDWLKSRAAWMTKKYNTYYIEGLGTNGWNTVREMENGAGINTYSMTLSADSHQFKISSDVSLTREIAEDTVYRDSTATSISYNPDINLVSSDSTKITNFTVTLDTDKNFSFTTSEEMTVYITYNQKTNTVTLSDTDTISGAPVVELEGVLSPDGDPAIGSSVALTATVTTAAIKDNAEVSGPYTVELYYNGNSILSKQVNLNEGATFTFEISEKSTKLSVKAYPVAEPTLVGTSDTLTYTVRGLADNKIYFDPSSDSSWKNALTETSVVTATAGTATFEMYIDTNDIHGLQKGVFVAYVDDDTLAAIQSKQVKFALNDSTLSYTTPSVDPTVKDGSIFTYTTEADKTSCWADYNVAVEESYPTASGATTYQEFVDYLATNTDKKVVYFDNSATQWYNAYVYDWNNGDVYFPMKKLKGFDNIFYYEVSSGTIPSEKFLFKDRSSLTFGTDYQQTVDFVDGFVYHNNTSTQLTISFTTSFGKVNNPIFQATGFYNITEQSGSGLYKNRAYANEWQDLSAILKAQVKASNVQVYFDIHDNQYDSISLKHSIVSGYVYTALPSETTLTRLGNSTIYSANILLPYVESENKLAFKFDGFVVNGTTYSMSTAVQPAYTCINTGEVWYEVNTNYATGAVVSVASEDSDYGIATADVSNYTMKAGDTLYYDFTKVPSGGVNYNNGSGVSNGYDSSGAGKVISVTLTSDMDFSNTSLELFKTEYEGWDPVTKSTILPSDGQNTIVVNSDGATYSWSTTKVGKYYYRGHGNGWGSTLMNASEDGYYDYIERTGSDSFKIAKSTSGWDYGKDYITPYFNNTDVNLAGSDNIECSETGTYYILVYYPNTTINTTADPIICASTTLPNNSSEQPTDPDDPDDPVVTTDYCGILGYNHSTATFVATTGGKIDDAFVNLTNGYYQDTAIKTGYTSFDGEKYTVIYALTSTGKTDASTAYSSTTSQATGYDYYKFAGWTKDGIVIGDERILTDDITSSATVNYVANWSEKAKVTYTFTYNYDQFDTSVQLEYKEGNLIENSDYKIKISLYEDATVEDVKTEYMNHIPKLQSDYFVYSFDGANITVDTTNYTAVAKASNTARTYSVTIMGESTETFKYNYQNVASVTREAPTGQKTVWKNFYTGATLYVGNTYKFRVTDDVIISYTYESDATITASTYVNEPTYEFYTSGTTEKVRFNFLVENFIGDKDVTEYGVIYFFTDSTGKPVDTTISYDAVVDKEKLELAALNGGNGSIKAKAIEANAEHKYIYAPSLTNNDANKFKYLRVQSYFKTSDGEIVLSEDYKLASIILAINLS